MQPSDTIFAANGILRLDLENVRVPPERRNVFDALVSAVKATEEAERQIKIVDASVTKAVEIRDAALIAFPRSTFMDEWRTMVGQRVEKSGRPSSGSGGNLDGTPSMDGRPGQPEQTLRTADMAVDKARHEQRLARNTLASARASLATALTAYNRSVTVISAEQNTRDWIASNNAARAERVRQNGHYQPNVTQTAKAMSGGGHGPANEIRTRRGGGSAYRRGPDGVQAYSRAQAVEVTAARIRATRAAAKLPSEK